MSITAINLPRSVKGFTLIELMVVLAIIAILAAIALPSYRRYVIANSERETQAKMLQLEIELEQWRAKTLSYKGFKPKNISTDNAVTYGYEGTTNQTVYVPNNSTASDYRYEITVVDGTDTANSLVSTADIDNTTGRTWKMLATPNPNGSVSTGRRIMLTSTGVRCMVVDSSVVISSADCGTGSQDW